MRSRGFRTHIGTHAALALACALVPAGSARADIFMTRRPDGTLHLTNVPAHRGPGSTVVIRSREGGPPRAGSSPVIAYDGSATPVATVTSLETAQVRSLYLATARDPGRYARFDAYILALIPN